MCYSAKIQANYREYVRLYGADVDVDTFQRLYFGRAAAADIKIPKALDAALLDTPISDDISSAIADYQRQRTTELEAELFAQGTRLADAERKLQVKLTKAASEDARIATNKIDAAVSGLDDLRRRELLERDSRIFPGWYAPVLIELGGKRLTIRAAWLCSRSAAS
ncbi:hypothetical protein QZM25_29860 [Burkholderia contaminans]|uniref:hypothetical protein n=1 Tax=Burkholderia cepacia complex TaxID=87882 RepID=UPI000A80DFB3|nr:MULTISPECIES: hypothetical protein [Burkholderia cepacia complex]MCA7888632.1 hypothetical protein [Burkholderia contaminans]MDN7576823.1 hypothetical protein [Burkholderia contaminans]